MNPKTRVLIIDDDVAMAKYLASHLSRRGFEVSMVPTGQEALRVFRTFWCAIRRGRCRGLDSLTTQACFVSAGFVERPRADALYDVRLQVGEG